jgi:hypothetical protein
MPFQGGRFDISAEELDKIEMEGVKDFDLKRRPPQKGEGVAIFNVSKQDAPEYNMNFMAVLSISEKKFVLSNLSEAEYKEITAGAS